METRPSETDLELLVVIEFGLKRHERPWPFLTLTVWRNSTNLFLKITV